MLLLDFIDLVLFDPPDTLLLTDAFVPFDVPLGVESAALVLFAEGRGELRLRKKWSTS